ncbi:MAG: phosphatase PAP2 family protein [Verrucomicrobiota bacterium]|nr:phosphatase PAP2 family protein [Verrucomicrobiota bacterium]
MDSRMIPAPEQPRGRFDRPLRFVQKRLSPNGYLGLHLTIGVFVVLLASWVFSEIAEAIRPGAPYASFDPAVTDWFQAHATATLTTLARVVTDFGSVGFITSASVATAAFFAFKRWWTRLLLFGLTMIGGSGLNILLKHFFHRHRPVLENPLVTLSSYGFPSGHTMGSTLFYGLLALLVVQSARRWSVRVAAVVCAGWMVVLVGLSRIYLGAHFLTDVLGAIAAGGAWLTLCWTAVETFRRRQIQCAAASGEAPAAR